MKKINISRTLAIVLCISSWFALDVFAGSTDTGSWSVVISKLDEWKDAPPLPPPAHITCHVYGQGKFRVLLRTSKGVIHRVVDAPLEDWVSFNRQLGEGPLSIKVESIPDPKIPTPKFQALIAASNPDYIPDLADIHNPVYFRMRNLSDKDVRVVVRGARHTLNDPIFFVGYVDKNGPHPKLEGALKAKESTGMINLSRAVQNRTALSFGFYDPVDVEIEFFTDAAGTKPLHSYKVKTDTPAVPGTISTMQYCLLFPNETKSPDDDKTYRMMSLQELFEQNLDALKEVDLSRPVPKKIWALANNIMDRKEATTDSLMAELKLAREIGFNGVFYDLGRLESERPNLGPQYGSVHPRYFPYNLNFNYRFTKEISELIAKNKPDFDKIKIPSIVDLADEPRFSEIPKSPALDADFVEWMKKKNLTPADAGVKDWSEVKVIAPNPELKRLSTFSRQFQMQEITGFWNGMATEIVAMNPLLKPTINWQCNEAYEGITIDGWEVYRQPGLGMVWGEDWYEYNPVGSGVTAWYAEIMRSQAKYRHLPLGSYPIFGYGGGYTQPISLFKVYERMMRGGSVFDFYPYSTIGNEGGWTDNPKNAVFLAKICRDMAAVEDIVVDGSVLPAHAAIVYQTSCMLWDRGAYANAMALYLAYLHSGIPVDVITEQDVMDGYAKGYSTLFLTGSNIRKDVLDRVDQFVKAGGTLVSSMPDVRNQFDEPIADGAQHLGLSELVSIKNDPIGSYVYGLSTMKPLDTVSWDAKEVKVYGQKSKMTPSADASVLAKFSDGAPALVKTPHGKGTIYQYAFSPWASYVRADYSTPKGLNKGVATILARNNTERQLCVLPLAKTPEITTYSEPMIGGRIMVGKDASFVGMVDYGCGKRGRETPNPIMTDFDFDTEPPFPVTVVIQCKKKPHNVTSVRSGNISWKYANGKVTAKVPLRGADMLILKGKDLF